MKEVIPTPSPTAAPATDQTPSSTAPAGAKPITLQSILECKEGTSIAIGKVLEGATTDEQLQRIADFQTQCLQSFQVVQAKLDQEVKSESNIKLSEALEKTQNRIIIEQKMLRFLIKSDTPGAGNKMGEEMLGFIFAAKMTAPQENEAWGEYRASLEAEKTAPPKGNTDFVGWGLLIIMLFIIGRALLKRADNKDKAESKSNEKPPV
jgi:hypothetical protein